MAIRTMDRANRKLWYAAIKPPMYSVAIMPIWVGSAIAYAEAKTFNPATFVTFLMSAILILAWENLSNDVFDSETGVDVNKVNSLVNMTGNKSLIFLISMVCLIGGLLGIASISYQQKDFMVVGLVLACCALGYVYQGPPFRLSYRGLGEPLCFLAFGPLAFSAAYYSQTQEFSVVNLAASVIVGITTTLILFCSHFNQVREDALVGKKSPVVRLGTKRSAGLLPWICTLVYALISFLVVVQFFPSWTLLSFVSIPVARRLCRFVKLQHHLPHRLAACRLVAVEMHFWSGLFLGLGFFFPWM